MNVRKTILGAFAAGLALFVGAALAGVVFVQKDDGQACFQQSNSTGIRDIACFAALSGSLQVTEGSTSAGVLSQFRGLPKLATWTIGVSINGAASSHTLGHFNYIDATPAGEWVATTNITSSTEGAIIYAPANAKSLGVAVVDAAVAGNGVDNTLAGGDEDWTADENYGMWIYSTIPLVAGDLVLAITDSVAGVTNVDFPAVSGNTWTWIKIDVSGVADASKDVIQSLGYHLSTAGAARGAFNFYVATAVKWDTGDEESLGQDVKTGGVFPLCVLDAAASANRPIVPVEYTDFIIDYKASTDSWIAITDQSANACGGIAAIN